MGQWKNGKVPSFKLKISRNERVTLEEQIDELLDALNVNRALSTQKLLYIRKDKSAMMKRWMIYNNGSMTPMLSSYFIMIEVHAGILNFSIDERKIGVSIENKFSEYNWINITRENHTFTNVKGLKRLSVSFENFDQLMELISKIMKYIR
ncbi:MAG: hypothetical protein K0R18_425 [Bacillales bacterium]|nr:hypothetical protein [Bacillales bacterium]